jgi:PiT family inorganic phosphate transporter
MTTTTLNPAGRAPRMDQGLGAAGSIGFGASILVAIVYVAYSVYVDASAAGIQTTAYLPFILLFIALLIALGFEFVNGFHDTANAVATVIYTNSMPANVAVVWSGFFNFIGVLLSSGAVAFGIISLLPVELILQVGSNAGFAMVFALLFSAITWNLATWALGIPSSSSHTLIGSVIGVGIANALMHGRSGTAGVDWTKAADIGKALLISPVLGFTVAALLFLSLKVLVRNKALYEAPTPGVAPPLWIRSLLIFTCTGVSFAHGSNDGQKGMGLIMLILIGTVPTAYALNRAVPAQYVAEFHGHTTSLTQMLGDHGGKVTVDGDPRAALTRYIADKKLDPQTVPALSNLASDIDQQVGEYGSLSRVPADKTRNMRNDMYLAAEAVKRLGKESTLNFVSADSKLLDSYKSSLDKATRFIPTWVKVSVAFALGLGTMIGWKRIVVTVGEKIGKTHLTYAQGASAELVAMATIGAADAFGMPVSTTHVLSSGVAGTMQANRSGLQMSTVRSLLMAWVLTLPVSIVLAGSLYWLLSKIF